MKADLLFVISIFRLKLISVYLKKIFTRFVDKPIRAKFNLVFVGEGW